MTGKSIGNNPLPILLLPEVSDAARLQMSYAVIIEEALMTRRLQSINQTAFIVSDLREGDVLGTAGQSSAPPRHNYESPAICRE